MRSPLGPSRRGVRRGVRKCRLRRGEARDGDAEGRTRDVGQVLLVEKADRCRIAAVLAADAELHRALDGARLFACMAYEPAHTGHVEGLKWVRNKQTLLDINGEEFAGVVSREAHR